MSLTSIPTELFYEVLKYVETDEDLYNLGLTCKHTHHPAFSTFLKRHGVDEPSDECNYFSAFQYPPLLFPLIQASLWIKFKDVIFLTCGINQGYDRIWNDLRDLTNLVEKMRSFMVMRLNLRQLDDWTTFTGYSQEHSKVLDKVKWANGVTKLLDAVIERGCLTLDVNGGEGLERFYAEEEPVWVPGMVDGQRDVRKALKKVFTSPFKKIISTVHRPRRPVPSRSSVVYELPGPRLHSVDLNHSPMFQHAFYPWTLKMFANNSSTITRLSLSCPYIPTQIMTHFLSSITLHHLDHLDITRFVYEDLLDTTHTVRFCDLVAFFGRHPSIETLDLQGVERPTTPRPPVLKTRILPRLKKIVAHPIWISTLVGLLDSFPDAYPLLESIGITTEHFKYPDISHEQCTYELLDDTLRKIAQASFPRPINLELQLITKRGMLKWFDEHASLGQENSVISSLSCVSALILTTRYHVWFGREEVYHLPGWLALFPALRSVSVKDVRQETDGYLFVEDKPLLRRIAAECPTLEMLNKVSLGTLLDGAERGIGRCSS